MVTRVNGLHYVFIAVASPAGLTRVSDLRHMGIDELT